MLHYNDILSLCESVFKRKKIFRLRKNNLSSTNSKDDYVKDYTHSNLVDTFHIYNQVYGLSKNKKEDNNINKNMIKKNF